MRNPGLELSHINWESVLPRFGVAASYLAGKQGPCPICPDGGKTRFRFDNKEGKGTWYCNRCGAGNGLTLVARVNGWTTAETARQIAEGERIVPIRPRLVASRSAPTRDELRSKLQRIWDESLPVVQGDPVWKYLHGRVPGLVALPSPGELRYHPELEYFEQVRDARGRTRSRSRGKHPAMLAKVRDPEGRPVNLHRTYLDSAGRKAAIRASASQELLDAKKMMTGVARYTGGAVHLYAPGEAGRVGVGEGIETMLAVRAAYGNRLAVWSCLNAGGVAKFQIPEWVTELHIFADNDRPAYAAGKGVGQEAAQMLLRRARKEGFELWTKRAAAKRVRLHVPRLEDTDFLDQWVARQGLRAA